MDKNATCKRTYQRFDLINIFLFSCEIYALMFWYGILYFHRIYKAEWLLNTPEKCRNFHDLRLSNVNLIGIEKSVDSLKVTPTVHGCVIIVIWRRRFPISYCLVP